MMMLMHMGNVFMKIYKPKMRKQIKFETVDGANQFKIMLEISTQWASKRRKTGPSWM